MDLLDKSIELINLYDLYQNLLTTKQRDYFEQYYFSDFSITEISENQQVSRNAVHDLIKRTIQKLYDFETKMELLKQRQKRNKIIHELKDITSKEAVLELLDELLKVE